MLLLAVLILLAHVNFTRVIATIAVRIAMVRSDAWRIFVLFMGIRLLAPARIQRIVSVVLATSIVLQELDLAR